MKKKISSLDKKMWKWDFRFNEIPNQDIHRLNKHERDKPFFNTACIFHDDCWIRIVGARTIAGG